MKMRKYCARREHSQKHNTHYLRIKCVLQAHHENNAYCVRIKSVLGKYASAHLQQPDGLMLLLTPVFVLPILVPSRHAATWLLSSRHS